MDHSTSSSSQEFERVVLPHLDAVYGFARWLTRNDSAAEDIAHDALLRAFRFFRGFRHENARAWLFSIVRTSCYTWLAKNKANEQTAELHEDIYSAECETLNPETVLARSADGEEIRKLILDLPPEFREVIVLREFEGLSYQEIAATAGIPIGTVMSRLARARRRLERMLAPPAEGR